MTGEIEIILERELPKITKQLSRIAGVAEAWRDFRPKLIKDDGSVVDLIPTDTPTPDAPAATDALSDELTIAIDSGIANLKTMEFSDIDEIKATVGSIIKEMEPPFDNYLKATEKPIENKSPDALVKAGSKMAYFLSTWEDTLAGNQMTQEDFDVDCGLPEWKKALAAHEKAGA